MGQPRERTKIPGIYRRATRLGPRFQVTWRERGRWRSRTFASLAEAEFFKRGVSGAARSRPSTTLEVRTEILAAREMYEAAAARLHRAHLLAREMTAQAR